MDLNLKIKELISPVLMQHEVELYDIQLKNLKRSKILEISIMKKEGSIDIDTCMKVSEDISQLLDTVDVIDGEYVLEVCSAGAERVLRNLDEVKSAMNHPIYVKFKKPILKNKLELLAELQSVEDEVLTVIYKEKAVSKKVSFAYNEIEMIRLAVKF